MFLSGILVFGLAFRSIKVRFATLEIPVVGFGIFLFCFSFFFPFPHMYGRSPILQIYPGASGITFDHHSPPPSPPVAYLGYTTL